MLAPSSGTLRVVERELRIFRRLWRGSIFTSFLTPVLFLAAMGFGLGGLVDERNADVAGVDYLEFLAPGLLAASAMVSAAGGSLWPVMGGMKWTRTFHAMVSTPLAASDVYGGFVAWISLRATISAAAFLLVATVLGAVPSPWGVLALPATALTAAAFVAPLAAFSATQDSDAAFPVIMRLGIVPLFLFSGTFFPLEQLPDGLEPLAVLSPLWHGVELCRGATTGSLDLLPALGHVAALLACVAAGCWWGARTFTRRLMA
ncbi:MAG: ABC transporter permease [Acidimicrobiia bacterium]|nr:ABC transporter permease [Acidimicrobiia bacterium]